MKAQTLYRAVGLREPELIAASEWRRFPPRSAWQPIFYPVLNEAYAAQIARDRNTGDAFSGCFGAVLRFEISGAYLAAFEPKHAGGEGHDELWIPAEEPEAFNRHLTSKIEIVRVFFSDHFDTTAPAPAIAKLLEPYYHEHLQQRLAGGTA